jgi:hypothetical protein
MREPRVLTALSAWAAAEISATTPWPTLGSRPLARAEQRAQIQTSNTMLEQMPDGGTLARWLGWWLGR